MSTTSSREPDDLGEGSSKAYDDDGGAHKKPRAARACDACRRMKTKCKIEDDVCEACRLAGRPCTFVHEGTKRERPPTKKDVEVLNAKIRSLERLLQRVAPGVDLTLLPRTVEQARTIINATRRMQAANVEPVSESEPDDEVDDDPAELSIEPGRYVGPHSALSVAQGDQAVPHPNAPTSTFSSQASWVEQKIETDHAMRIRDDRLFPPPDLAASLVALYFQHVHRWYPILHQATFIELLKANAAGTDASFRSLCYAVFAAASRFSEDPRVRRGLDGEPLSRRGSGAVYATVSSNFTSMPSSPWSLWSLQSAAVLSQYLLINSTPMTAWGFTGLALRRAQDVGAHRENSSLWTSDVLTDQQRKRAFWMLFFTDRQLHFMLGRAPSMRVDDLDLEPPLFVPDTTLTEIHRHLPGRITPTARQGLAKVEPPADRPLYVVWRCWWRVRREVHRRSESQSVSSWDANPLPAAATSSADARETREFDAKMNKIIAEVPESLTFSPTETDPEKYVAAIWHHTQNQNLRLLSHRRAVGDAQNFESVDTCIDCADQLVRMFDNAQDRGMLEDMSFFAPFHLSTTVMLLAFIYARRGAQQTQQSQQITSTLEKALRLLDILAKTGAMAHRFLTIAMGILPQIQARIVKDRGAAAEPFGLSSLQQTPPSASAAPPLVGIPEQGNSSGSLGFDEFAAGSGGYGGLV